MYLIENSILCPIGNAIVERLFSLLKIVKTDMRNSLGNPNPDKILRINKDAPKKLSDMELETLVDKFKDYSESKKVRLQL